MKKLLFLFFLFINSLVSGKTRYVAPTGGSDSNSGKIDAPWATIQHGIDQAVAGDTIYLRGGIWLPTIVIDWDVPRHGNDGTAADHICLFNYPGEIPIIDGTKLPANRRGIAMLQADYIEIKGVTCRNMLQDPLPLGNESYGISVRSCNHITIENCTVHNIGGNGYHIVNSDQVHLINCDVYDCCDPYNIKTPGGGSNGFMFIASTPESLEYYIFAYGCRAWNISDDCFDTYNGGHFVWEKCWAWNCGKNVAIPGDGNGFKFGLISSDPSIAREFKNCISAFNAASGFRENNDNYARMNMFMYNNIAYKNGHAGFSIMNPSTHLENENVYRNNISYKNTYDILAQGKNSFYIHDHNSWDIPVAITDSDLGLSGVTDEVAIGLLSAPRNSDGSLPDLHGLFHPAKGSALIDKGVILNLPYNDSLPDLGAFEYDSGNPTVEITSPSSGSTFSSPATITITASASDADGISKVEFFNGATYLGDGVKTLELWSFIWNYVMVGDYSLSAIATDNSGTKTTSSSVYVNVRSDIINLYPNPNNGFFTLALTDPLPDNSKITIASVDGKVIYIGTISREELTKQFNLPYIRPGEYILVISGSAIILTKKFTKE
jgi:parallel beta-helix repeat protein